MPKLDYGTSGYHGLSHSRLEAAKRCWRFFQLEHVLGFVEHRDTVTFSYGHAVAAGVQSYIEHGCEKLAACAVVANYDMPWKDEGTTKERKDKKSVWYALRATQNFIQKFHSQLPTAIDELTEYEVATITLPTGEQAPAVELQFRILLENGFVYEGHIDLIMQHKVTGEYIIVELKTTKFRDPHNALYQNSNQALGYSIILDKIAQHMLKQANYKVFYLIYSSSMQDWFLKVFPKPVNKRFDWINNLIRETEIIQYYQDAAEQGIPYPTNGHGCYDFFTPCKYLGSCEMDDENLSLLYKPLEGDEAFAKSDNVVFEFTIQEIIDSQVALAESRSQIPLSEVTDHVPDEI